MAIERTFSIVKPDAVGENHIGAIRADFATQVDENAVYGSDAPETAAAEIAFFFPEGVCERTR